MRFRTKNTFYLRTSVDTVVPLYLYLDEKHIEWMSERILNALLEDLRQAFSSENAEDQLREGLKGKKTDVTIRKRDIYQFAYFFRKSQPHSVLFKTRTFTEEKTPEGKGKVPETSIEISDDDDGDGGENNEEEQKPKLKMRVSYKGLTVTEKCLCIIIEPRTSDTADDLRQSTLDETVTQRQKALQSASIVQQQQRERTPLFLPDLDDFDRATPAPFISSRLQRTFSEFEYESPSRLLPQEGDNDGAESNLYAFGKTLNSIDDGMAGEIDDEDGDEGEAFLGDADERKGAL